MIDSTSPVIGTETMLLGPSGPPVVNTPRCAAARAAALRWLPTTLLLSTAAAVSSGEGRPSSCDTSSCSAPSREATTARQPPLLSR